MDIKEHYELSKFVLHDEQSQQFIGMISHITFDSEAMFYEPKFLLTLLTKDTIKNIEMIYNHKGCWYFVLNDGIGEFDFDIIEYDIRDILYKLSDCMDERLEVICRYSDLINNNNDYDYYYLNRILPLHKSKIRKRKIDKILK